MSNFLQKQSMNERLLRTEDDSSKEEGTFYENPMNKENNNNTVQNNNSAYDNKHTMPQSVKYALRFIFVCIVLVVAYICLIYAAGPALTNSTMKQVTMTITNCNMTSPDPVSIGLDCNSTINNGGSVAATMHSTIVNVSTRTSPILFGYMELPTVRLNKNAPSYLNIKSRLYVTDVPSFTKACFSVLQGFPAEWQIIGHPDITVEMPLINPTFSKIKLDKFLMLPATLLRRVRSSSINILNTTKTTVFGMAEATFFSSSILQLLNLGEMHFEMQTAEGYKIGTVYAKKFNVKQGFNTLSNMSVHLQPDPFNDPNARKGVSNFIQAYLSAQDQTLKLHGPVANKAPFLNALVEQDIYIPGVQLLNNIQVVELDIVKGTKDAMYAKALVQFVSNSAVGKGSLGQLTFEIISKQVKNTKVAIAHLPLDMEVKVGINFVNASVLVHTPDTDDEKRAVSLFVSAFLEGRTSLFAFRGPVNHVNPLLNNVIVQSVSIAGTKDPSLLVSVYTDRYVQQGFKVPNRTKKLRGAIVVSKNPYNVPVTISNVVFDVHLLYPMKWTFKNSLMTGSDPVTCTENRYGRMFYAPGMKQYPHTCAQEKCDTSDMRAEVDLKPGTFTSFFVPAVPMPGQNDYKKCCPICNDDVSPYDCCFTSLTLAASCRAQQKGSSYFLSRTNGTMDMKVGDFEIKTVEYSQPSVPSLYSAEVTDGYLIDAEMKCKDVDIIY